MHNLYSWWIIQSCIKIASISWVDESEQTCLMYFIIFFFTENFHKQTLKRLSFQTEKDFWKCFSVQHIFNTAFCDKPCLFNDLSITRSPYVTVSERPNELYICMKRPKITTCYLNLSGKVDINGKAFINTTILKVFIVYFWPTASCGFLWLLQ